MKTKILMIAIFMALTVSLFAQKKPSEMSPQTIAAFKTVLGVLTPEDASLNFVPKIGGSFSGAIKIPTAASGTADSTAASTAFVNNLLVSAGIGRVVLRKTTRVSHTGNTNETTVFTGTIPGNSIGISGGFHIISTYFGTNSGNLKTFKIYFNGTLIGTSAIASNTTTRGYHTIYNREDSNIQISPPATSNSGGVFYTAAVTTANTTYTFDTTQDITVDLKVTLALGTESAGWDTFEIISYY